VAASFESSIEPSGCMKCREFLVLAEKQVALQGGLCSVGLVSSFVS
jgi:hypothetical protein